MKVEATVVVKFGNQVEDYVFILELDDILNTVVGTDGEEEVKTSFNPGDIVHLRYNKSDNVTVKDIITTSGNISRVRDDIRQGKDTYLFTSRESNDPSIYTVAPSKATANYIFVGRAASLSRKVDAVGRLEYTADAANTPTLVNFNYSFPTTIYKLIPPNITIADGESYTVAVVFYIEVD